MSKFNLIKQKIIDKNYYIFAHSEEEMFEDGLSKQDIENSILKGVINKKMTSNIRGIRYRIEGPALDNRKIHTVCRFKEKGDLIIITVYALEESYDM